MASNNNDNNLKNMPDEVKDLIASSLKKDIVAMCNIKCTSKSLSHVNHTTPERRFLIMSREIIDECVTCAKLIRIWGMAPGTIAAAHLFVQLCA